MRSFFSKWSLSRRGPFCRGFPAGGRLGGPGRGRFPASFFGGFPGGGAPGGLLRDGLLSGCSFPRFGRRRFLCHDDILRARVTEGSAASWGERRNIIEPCFEVKHFFEQANLVGRREAGAVQKACLFLEPVLGDSARWVNSRRHLTTSKNATSSLAISTALGSKIRSRRARRGT